MSIMKISKYQQPKKARMTSFFKLRFLLFLSYFIIISLSNPVNSIAKKQGSLGPLNGRNQAPILNLFYVMQASNTRTLGQGNKEVRFDLDISNIQERYKNLTYDMEIYRPSLQISYGILDNIDVHMEVPALSFKAGKLDRIIQDYHDIFGFPNGGREFSPNNSFDYSYNRNGKTFFDFSSRDATLSDINLDIKWVVNINSWLPPIALRSGIKLPTGDFKKGTGSGGYDYSFGAAFDKSVPHFNFFGGMDITFIDVPDKLNPMINDDEILHYYFGAEYIAIKNHLSFIVQIDNQNTPFAYAGEITLDREISEVTTGFKGSHYDELLLWQLSLREDIIPHSTVDFTISFSLGSRF